jgi:hypothetical protein
VNSDTPEGWACPAPLVTPSCYYGYAVLNEVVYDFLWTWQADIVPLGSLKLILTDKKTVIVLLHNSKWKWIEINIRFNKKTVSDAKVKVKPSQYDFQ